MSDNILSPTDDKFSTPPSTPGLAAAPVRVADVRPSLSRKNSRPSSLSIDQAKRTSWNPDVVLESPDGPSEISPKTARGNLKQPQTSVPARMQAPQHQQAMKSPCFVHSHLDKGASLADWLRTKQRDVLGSAFDDNTPSIAGSNGGSPFGLSRSSSMSDSAASDDEDYGGGSLTKQLAATAVGVREMSKQLGRARVRSNIQNVLIITKARDNRLIKLTHELALYLMLKPRNGERGLVVYVDNQLRTSRRFDAEGIERDHPELFIPFPRRRSTSSNSLASMAAGTKEDYASGKDEGQLRYWTSDMCSNSPHLFDFVVTLGGDGTVLFTSWLFQRIVPPVLPFALGSLGFLTNFDFADHQSVMDSALDNGIRVNLRMRFTCVVYRAVAIEQGKGRKAVKKGETGEIMMKNVEKGGWEALEGGWSGYNNADGPPGAKGKDKEIMCFTTRPVETFEILNDLVVDRGPSPYVSLLELFGDEHHMTTVQADGLTVSTPTGSTAYSLSAGGSLVHPEIPALLITPICPHTLSFRPMLLPDSMELRICVPFNSRSTAWASFDGRGRVELKQGDHIKVTASKYPFPTVCADKQSTDWFNAISRTLKWNERERQKSFVVVEEGPAKHKRRSSKIKNPSPPTPDPVEEELAEDDEEDEVSDEDEEDKFDIDDSSPEAAKAAAAAEAQAQEERKSRVREVNPFVRAASARARSRSGLRSGVQTPSRFAGPQPHPEKLSPRHVEFMSQSDSSSESLQHIDGREDHRGLRDDIHSPPSALSSGRSKIPKDRDVEADSMKTPTVGEGSGAKRHQQPHHTRHESADSYHAPRAFAVWGHDESDSNASDSDP